MGSVGEGGGDRLIHGLPGKVKKSGGVEGKVASALLLLG